MLVNVFSDAGHFTDVRVSFAFRLLVTDRVIHLLRASIFSDFLPKDLGVDPGRQTRDDDRPNRKWVMRDMLSRLRARFRLGNIVTLRLDPVIAFGFWLSFRRGKESKERSRKDNFSKSLTRSCV